MKFDLHVHSCYSPDSVSLPISIMRTAKKKGLDGVAITDHNNADGWEAMQKAADETNMKLILGQEVKIIYKKEMIGELLTLFLNKPIESHDYEKVIKKTHKQRGIVSIAHPFREIGPFTKLNLVVEKIDAVEAYNSRCFFNKGNLKAREFALKNNLGITAGSDAHTPWEIGNAYIEADAKDLNEFKNKIIKDEVTFKGKLYNPMYSMFNKVARTTSKARC